MAIGRREVKFWKTRRPMGALKSGTTLKLMYNRFILYLSHSKIAIFQQASFLQGRPCRKLERDGIPVVQRLAVNENIPIQNGYSKVRKVLIVALVLARYSPLIPSLAGEGEFVQLLLQ